MKRILITDDEPMNLKMTEFVLKKNGYERVTGMLEDYPRGHVMYCMQKSI